MNPKMTVAALLSTVMSSEISDVPSVSSSLNGLVQCAADVPDYKEKCGNNVTPPICKEDEACRTNDGCKYDCIKKTECPDTLFNSLLENGKLLCNCAKEPTFKYSWACEFDDNKHGYAVVPQINKVYGFDNRKIRVLEGNRTEKYQELVEKKEDFVNFFETSPCIGVSNTTEESVTFDDLFNNQQCLPYCETVNKTNDQDEEELYEKCSAVIGYDDLTVSLGGDFTSPAVLQKGQSWMLTCNRYLHGEGSGVGSVTDAPMAPVTDIIDIDTKFNLDIHCCDPADDDCFDDCKNEPVFQIGPYADLDDKRFFVSMDFEYGKKAIRERGFLHIETCTFEEFGKDDSLISGPLEVLHDGCPTEFTGVTFLENLRPRTVEESFRETMDMKPFRINSEAYYFRLTCEMLNCPWDAKDNKLCQVKDQCYLEDRYEPFYSYVNGGMRARSAQSQSSDSVTTETITRELKHPCSEVERTGENYCVGNEDSDCWTVELCQNRQLLGKVESSGSPVSLASLTAIALTLMV